MAIEKCGKGIGMAYQILIERSERPIMLEEWLSIVDTEPLLRRATSALDLDNPQTGETISFPLRAGDTEMLFPESGTWERTFFWSRHGYIFFRRPDGFEAPEHPIRKLSMALAKKLEAQLVGEEGEVYW